MAPSRNDPRSGRGLDDITATPFSSREEGGLNILFEPSGYEGPDRPPPLRESRDRGYNIFDPQEGPPKPWRRPKPGLGEPGKEKIEREFSRTLPYPQTIYPIKQSTKGKFATSRPDKYPEYWSAASSKQSTRVYAAQWIPTGYAEIDDDSDIVMPDLTGDLFIAFARPSKNKSSLFRYLNVSKRKWNTFKTETSYGKFINTLGGVSPYTDEDFQAYRDLHPGYADWLFNDMGKWMSIRPDNEAGGEERVRGASKRVTAAAERIVEEKIGSYEEFVKKRRGY